MFLLDGTSFQILRNWLRRVLLCKTVTWLCWSTHSSSTHTGTKGVMWAAMQQNEPKYVLLNKAAPSYTHTHTHTHTHRGVIIVPLTWEKKNCIPPHIHVIIMHLSMTPLWIAFYNCVKLCLCLKAEIHPGQQLRTFATATLSQVFLISFHFGSCKYSSAVPSNSKPHQQSNGLKK